MVYYFDLVEDPSRDAAATVQNYKKKRELH